MPTRLPFPTAPSSAPTPAPLGPPIDDDGALSVPAAWRVGETWHIRRYVTNSHGETDVAEYALDDDDVAEILCQLYCRGSGELP